MRKIFWVFGGIILFAISYFLINKEKPKKNNNVVIVEKSELNIKDNQTEKIIQKNNENEVEFVKIDTIPTPQRIKELVKSNIKYTIQTDFMGNNKADYIAITEADKFGNYKDYWINSDFQIIKNNNYSADADAFYFRLINIDMDIQPEILRIDHYEDGIDYYFTDDVINNNKILFYFTPIFQEDDTNYYAYSNEIGNVLLKNADGVELKVAIEHKIIRDGNITILDDQKILPAIFFKGKVNDKELNYEEIGKMEIKWMKLSEIMKQIKK